jgi:hypothetical protein
VDADLGGGGAGLAVGGGHRVAHAELAHEGHGGGLGGSAGLVDGWLGRGGGRVLDDPGRGVVAGGGDDGGGGGAGHGGRLGGVVAADHDGGGDPDGHGEHAGRGGETEVNWTHC